MMRFQKGVTLFISLSLVLLANGVVDAQEYGGRSGEFLRFGVGGRALGMGKAFVAVADDASGVYWNPAGILGVKRTELMSMYSNLYFDTQFAFMGLVLPRPAADAKSRVLRALFGPSTAVGFGWVGVSTAGYEQRTSSGLYLGDFDVGEQAFFTSWSRESVGAWGIFRYGLTLKLVSQNFGDLQASSEMALSDIRRDWSTGMDVGVTFQPIHAPLLRIVSLKYLLPLRFGAVIQNLRAPYVLPKTGWETADGTDRFPMILRWGFSYRILLKDWLPDSWTKMRRFVGKSQVLIAFDKETCLDPDEDYEGGRYLGFEATLPLFHDKILFFPRFGVNNRTENMSLGVGLSVPFTSSARVRVDYAYGFHPYFSDDNRFFVTLQMGKKKGPAHFLESYARSSADDPDRMDDLLRILSEYPNEHVLEAVVELAEVADTTRSRRYYDLTGGLGRARWLFKEAKNLMRQGRIDRAQGKAMEAAREYAPLFIQTEHTLTDRELMDYGESLVIAGRVEEALSVLIEVGEPTMRSYYLMGVCRKALGDWEDAIEAFRQGVRRYEVEQDIHSMMSLSFLGLGETLLREAQYQSALTTLNVLLKNYSKALDVDYPRYPAFEDGYVLDDAQYLSGLCLLLLDPSEEGVSGILQTLRFYPGLSYGRSAETLAEILVALLEREDSIGLENTAKRLLEEYFQDHRWPLE